MAIVNGGAGGGGVKIKGDLETYAVSSASGMIAKGDFVTADISITKLAEYTPTDYDMEFRRKNIFWIRQNYFVHIGNGYVTPYSVNTTTGAITQVNAPTKIFGNYYLIVSDAVAVQLTNYKFLYVWSTDIGSYTYRHCGVVINISNDDSFTITIGTQTILGGGDRCLSLASLTAKNVLCSFGTGSSFQVQLLSIGNNEIGSVSITDSIASSVWASDMEKIDGNSAHLLLSKNGGPTYLYKVSVSTDNTVLLNTPIVLQSNGLLSGSYINKISDDTYAITYGDFIGNGAYTLQAKFINPQKSISFNTEPGIFIGSISEQYLGGNTILRNNLIVSLMKDVAQVGLFGSGNAIVLAKSFDLGIEYAPNVIAIPMANGLFVAIDNASRPSSGATKVKYISFKVTITVKKATKQDAIYGVADADGKAGDSIRVHVVNG